MVASPSWLAVTRQVPAPVSVSVVPSTVQAPAVEPDPTVRTTGGPLPPPVATSVDRVPD